MANQSEFDAAAARVEALLRRTGQVLDDVVADVPELKQLQVEHRRTRIRENRRLAAERAEVLREIEMERKQQEEAEQIKAAERQKRIRKQFDDMLYPSEEPSRKRPKTEEGKGMPFAQMANFLPHTLGIWRPPAWWGIGPQVLTPYPRFGVSKTGLLIRKRHHSHRYHSWRRLPHRDSRGRFVSRRGRAIQDNLGGWRPRDVLGSPPSPYTSWHNYMYGIVPPPAPPRPKRNIWTEV